MRARVPSLLLCVIADQTLRTEVDFEQVAYNTGLDESFFSTARLSRMEE
jgi:hypothetical protein